MLLLLQPFLCLCVCVCVAAKQRQKSFSFTDYYHFHYYFGYVDIYYGGQLTKAVFSAELCHETRKARG